MAKTDGISLYVTGRMEGEEKRGDTTYSLFKNKPSSSEVTDYFLSITSRKVIPTHCRAPGAVAHTHALPVIILENI